jgi:hypothetical protein
MIGALMPKRRQWNCDRIGRQHHVLPDNEVKNLLAEVWEILLTSSCQLRNPVQIVSIDHLRCLPNSKRRARK